MDLLSLFTSFPSIIIFVIELALGLGLGYYSTKVAKYILALLGIFAVGVILNVWQAPQLNSSLNDTLQQLELTWNTIVPVIMSFIYLIGLTTILPITIGFVIGLVIALVK